MKIGDLSGTIERARLAGRIAIISLILSFILAVVVINVVSQRMSIHQALARREI